jgi:hypothetical protein
MTAAAKEFATIRALASRESPNHQLKHFMKMTTMTTLATVLIASAIGTSSAWAKKNGKTPLTDVGREFEAGYTQRMEALKAEIAGVLPEVTDRDKAAYRDAREAENAAKQRVEAAEKRLGEINRWKGLIGHAKGKWIGGADKGIAKAEKMLENARTDAERRAAEEELAKWRKNREEGVDALEERRAGWEKAKKDLPETREELEAAREAHARAKADTLALIQDLGLKSFLSNDRLDAKLAEYVVMKEATPRGLVAFAQGDEARNELLERMFSADDLLVRMAVADGAAGGRYGRAMEIYSAIREAGDPSAEGVLERLALALSLEHAVPVNQRNAKADADAPTHVDPVKRYLHYEQAFLGDELDPAFADLSVWELRKVVDGQEPDEILTWGREMLRNYRPDHITTDDYRWRYVALVRSDISYGSQNVKDDKDELQFFQNILMNGGICGRRAFIGRFMLRAFGIPTTARPQRGHAALAHWTPDGWVVNLGGGWGAGWTKGAYGDDLNFLATTQARETGETYKMVKRAHWIGDVMGEKRTWGLVGGDPAFWNGVALYTQRAIIETSKAKTLAAVGEDIAEANVTKEKIEITDVKLSEADRKVSVDEQGAITIPAAATSEPTRSTGKIRFMDSVLGGKQLHYSRNAGNAVFEYEFDAPAAGKYALSARLVTPSWQQNLMLSVNGAEDPLRIPLPFTVGMWDQTEPVTVELAEGENTLRFTRKSDGHAKGFSIKEFTLTPVTGQVSQVAPGR